MKNEIDIQEIQSSEYVGELNVIKEETVEGAEIKEIEKVKVEDVQISREVTKIQESVLKEAVNEMSTMKLESTSVAEAKELVQDVKIEESISEASDIKIEIKDECAQLKITKEEITEVSENVEVEQEVEVNIKKSVQINESQNKYQTFVCESSIENSEFIQEASFTAKSVENLATVQQSFSAKTTEDKKNLTLELKKSDSQSSIKSTIDTPTPSTIPPTPLTDEYVFRLQAPLPKLTGPPVPRSPSPNDEDPNIVKKKLIPHIDTEIIEEIVYDVPLPTPPEDKVTPPVYTKPGLRGGNMRYVFKKKEEIQEIERKSSLLASAIDETIKSIQEYKEEVGIDTKTEPIVYNGYAKVIKTKVFNLDTELPVNVEQQVIKNTDTINKIVENRDSVQNKEALENSCEVIETTEAKMGENEDVSVDGYRPVPFNPDDAPHLERVKITIPGPTPTVDPGKAFVTPNGGDYWHPPGVDFKKIKPIVESLKDSEVLKALNEEFMRTQEEKKKEERKWTKFLQKPSRPVPKAKFGYHGYTATEEEIEDFNTGPLPWEERALNEPPAPPVEPEEPILECQQTTRKTEAVEMEANEVIEESNENAETIIEEVTEEREEATQNGEVIENGVENGEEQKQQEKYLA
ncbi:hypothetical protein MSG28_016195 [Choristoneura fumiferana]|uniref:Uncharacterized protein n=5 Tax=Choristoneura fumiferana TaxID=7141 RepID=A0ACC0K6I1_CHOFU|nr:hypothetical protein MSG28_016195 [Choristoneura fumiferana]KAI8431761.1 hypothetical protein MSG28_016195 [Choristoneura fumiferana]KAI8431762.1 hypothetical protein MSG28_016195 [Choristoneura fumiferana]KAI8431765.1 hypothetical protein MSG28_016195 [Choristoneura fumiferana]KAI8431766.1 hypothetical protein MSG28_016195 [Choristoneura fumiferana]